jgi:hypothetical protein
MKTLVVLALATIGWAVEVPAALGQTPAGDSVTGRATDCFDDIPGHECNFTTVLDVDASSGPSGENPTGTTAWEQRISQFFISGGGPVTCLAASGNTAIVGSRVIVEGASTRTLIRVVDGGGARGQDSFEVFTEFSFGGSPLPPPNCASFPPNWRGTVVTASGDNDLGDIVVHDAVDDSTPPVLTVPSDITRNARSLAGTQVTYTATATDNVDPSPQVVCTPPSGSTFPIGKTTVSCAATDETGNKATKSFNVTVRLPVSKNECKNGGWRNFGTVFRNQGDCVSFVATNGKNPPGGH